jgi:DNA polymerase-3 subunit gamma/tau
LQEHLQKVCDQESVKVEKGVLPLVVRASGGSVRDALSVLGQLLAGAGKDGVTYDIAVQLLGFTDGALLDEAIDGLAARDLGSVFQSIDRLIESGHDPRRFAQDLLERLRDLVVVDAVDDGLKAILRNYPDDQIDRMRAQAARIGGGNLSRAASIVAEGLNQMRGATAPRLILELIASRIVIAGNDNSDQGLLARIERLERQSGMETIPAPKPTKPEVKQEVRKELKPEIKPEIKKEVKISESVKPSGNLDVTALRRMWPDVIENVKKRRRLTWSLLSASAQILSIDEKTITIGIVNAGARDSFIRSESEPILSDAFVDVTGVRRKIEVIVDPSVDPLSAANMTKRVDEDPSDESQLNGTELIMKELGAKVIQESDK